MIERDTSPAEIDTESEDIPVRDLSYFLYYFRAAYVTALEKVEQENTGYDFGHDETEQLAYSVSQKLGDIGYPAVSKNALVDLPVEKDLTFRDIARRNPIDVVFGGVGIALAAAVILSGGEFKIDKQGIRVKLPPLGVGIAELKKAAKGDFDNIQRGRQTDDAGPDDPLDVEDNDDPNFGP